MLSFLVAALFLAVKAQPSITNYEPFSLHNPFSQIENNITPIEASNRKSLLSNRVTECDMEDLVNVVGLNEIHELIEALAARKGTTSFAILRTLQKRMKSKEEMDENMKQNDRVAIPHFISPPLVDIPPPVRLPPIPTGAIYSVPTEEKTNTNNEEKTDVIIIPVAPSQNNMPQKLPTVNKAVKSMGETPDIFGNVEPPFGRSHHMPPNIFPLPPMKNQQLRPQFGATVRVNSNDLLSPLNRDVIVTVSPFMTVIEAIRQAEIKFQNLLGLNHDTDIFTFSHSSLMDCYIVKEINGVTNNDEHAWKVTIADRENQVVYNNFCLPSGRDAFVKPGAMISISYISL